MMGCGGCGVVMVEDRSAQRKDLCHFPQRYVMRRSSPACSGVSLSLCVSPASLPDDKQKQPNATTNRSGGFQNEANVNQSEQFNRPSAYQLSVKQ